MANNFGNSINSTIGVANSGATNTFTVINPSNTASSKALVKIETGGTSADDAVLTFQITGSTNWTVGIDNSDSDSLCIVPGSVLGGTTAMRFDGVTSNVSILQGNLDVTVSSSGGNVSSTISNTSNTASSQALSQITVAGTSAGDAIQTFTVSGTTNWTHGIDNSASDAYVLAASTALGTTNVISASTAGQINYPLQPAFLAYLTTGVPDVTGDGTLYTIIYDTEVYDVGSNFNLGTSTFTAPVTGKYLFSLSCAVVGNGAVSNCDMQIITSGRTYFFNMFNDCGTTVRASSYATVLADMTATQTATFAVQTTDAGGKLTATLGTTGGKPRNIVSGYLVC